MIKILGKYAMLQMLMESPPRIKLHKELLILIVIKKVTMKNQSRVNQVGPEN